MGHRLAHVQFGGYGSQVNIHDFGGTAKHWFDDSDYADPSTDVGDGEVNRQGTDLAVVRGYGAAASPARPLGAC